MLPLIPVSRCRPNAGTFVEYEGRELAVFLLGDPPAVVVTDNACPHASGNLSGGEVKNQVVTCPWHHWEFDLQTGTCVHSPVAKVRRYPAAIRDEWVCIDLEAS